MADARIIPNITTVRSGEAELSRITGTQTLSGIPVTIAPVTPQRPQRISATRARGHRAARRQRPRTSPSSAA